MAAQRRFGEAPLTASMRR